jgi:hypothetical protein
MSGLSQILLNGRTFICQAKRGEKEEELPIFEDVIGLKERGVPPCGA